jgi:hypothetical protein
MMKKAATPIALSIPNKLNNTYVCVRACGRVCLGLVVDAVYFYKGHA